MKKILLLCLVVLQVLTTFAGTAATGTEFYTNDGFRAKVLEDGSVAITWIYNTGEVTIPSEVTDKAEESTGSYKVSKVGDEYAVYDNDFISKVLISEGITSIAQRAFQGKTSIVSLYLPSTLNSIGDYAFYDCTGLRELYCCAATSPVLGDQVFRTSGNLGWNYIGENCKLTIPRGSTKSYQGEPWTYWNTFKSIVQVEILTTAQSGFATYWGDCPVNYSSCGLVAYSIVLNEAEMKVSYTKIEGVVPANTAVLVKGDSSKKYFLVQATEDAVDVNTDLNPSDGSVVTSGGVYYAFATINGKSGFKKCDDNLTIPSKKGYLRLSSPSVNAKEFIALDDEATGISRIHYISAKKSSLFNLGGQHVSENYKGIVIKNGKKIVRR